MGIRMIRTSYINEAVYENPFRLITDGEAYYHKELEKAADSIERNAKTHPVVLISGPSGSGKTTSAHRISRILGERGFTSRIISMDNYFLPNDMIGECPRNPDGSMDYESPLRLDLALLQEHLIELSNGKTIEMPKFDFITQTRSGTIPIKREPNGIIIAEGIHALNPLVTGDSCSFATCVYVSVRTRIMSQNGDILHPRLIRLMRRLSRDKLFRGRPMPETFKMFESVSRGEELYIMPYKTRADYDIDTFMPFEAAIYKNAIYDELCGISKEMSGSEDYAMLYDVLTEIAPLELNYIPETSLVREFVGGSHFELG